MSGIDHHVSKKKRKRLREKEDLQSEVAVIISMLKYPVMIMSQELLITYTHCIYHKYR